MKIHQFHGGGMDTSPIKGDEAARHRDMFRELDENFIKHDPKTLEALQRGGRVIVAFGIMSDTARAGAPLVIFSGVSAFIARTFGWL